MTQRNRWYKMACSWLLVAVMLLGLVPGVFAEETKLFNDYNTRAEADAAADALNLELSEEGIVLMKNDGLLPLTGKERISVFGVKQDNLVGGAGNTAVFAGSDDAAGNTGGGVADALIRAGFQVNPTLRTFYAKDSSAIGAETLAFTGEAKASMEMYNDVAVIVFSRTGGEGSDLETVMTELVPADDDHLALKRCNENDYDAKYNGKEEYFDAEGYHYHKHYLMLTDSEEELVEFVTERFDKVIIVLNTSNVMEVGDLQNSDAISAIIDLNRPGATGIDALAEIIAGTVTPSGHTVDEWMSDLTTDPTWYNITYNKQNNSSNKYIKPNGDAANATAENEEGGSGGGDKANYFGVDYEEGIYLGYKYYETYYYDIYNGNQPIPEGYEWCDSKESAAWFWYNDHVTYPFGYGLSYTAFSFIAGELYTDAECWEPLGDSVDAALFNSEAGSPAQIKTLYLPVTVYNEGDVAGKEVVQVYVTAPYTAGGIEKASVVLVGFAKTSLLKPGQSETVVVSFNVQDFASYDFNDANGDGILGDYELDAGEYIVRVMENSHFDCDTDLGNYWDAYDEVTFTLSETAHLKLDDFSDLEVGNKLSAENGVFNEEDDFNTMYYNSVRTAELMADPQYVETILSRADMAGTFPKAPVYEKDENGNYYGDLVFNQKAVDNWIYWETFNLNDGYKDAETDIWYIDDDTLAGLMEGWTQGQDAGIRFADMAGVPLSETETWKTFLNQITYDELKDLVVYGGYSTVNVDSVGKAKAVDADGPNQFTGTHQWCDEVTIASTWNVDLAEKEGRLMGCYGMFTGTTGWYGPGMDTHRSPFSGRNNEYYSQDGLQGGYIAAAVVKGAESKGLICYIKHLAFNDQETCRDGKVQFVWATEQALRENYIKMFQMAAQEGGSSAAMTGYARLGGIPNASNYQLLTGMLQDEWGWEGYLVTDGYIGWEDATELDLMVRAGYSLELYTSPYVEYLSGDWDADANSVRITVEATGESYISNLQWYYVRQSAMAILAKTANSTNNLNGFGELDVSGKAFTAQQFINAEGLNVGIDAAILGDSTAAYSVVGALPEGLSLDASTGEISGKAQQAGDYAFAVNAVIDTYVTKTIPVTLTVESAFYMDEEWDALDEAKVGKSFESKIESKVFTLDKYESVVYSLLEGELPDGIELTEDGKLTGKPTTAGEYQVTVQAEATKAAQEADGSSGGGSGSEGSEGGASSTDTGTFTFTIIVSD